MRFSGAVIGFALFAGVLLLAGLTSPVDAGVEPAAKRAHALEIKLRFAEERLALHQTISGRPQHAMAEMQIALKAAQALRDLAVAKEENSRLRERVAFVEAELARLRTR